MEILSISYSKNYIDLIYANNSFLKLIKSVLYFFVFVPLTIISIFSYRLICAIYNANDKESQKIIETNYNLCRASDVLTYSFIYNGEEFVATYSNQVWTIPDSHKIKNKKDINYICSKLIELGAVPNENKTGYRNIESLSSEWVWHNIAYEWFSYFDFLKPFLNAKERAATVDLDYSDDGKNLFQIIYDRLFIKKEIYKI